MHNLKTSIPAPGRARSRTGDGPQEGAGSPRGTSMQRPSPAASRREASDLFTAAAAAFARRYGLSERQAQVIATMGRGMRASRIAGEIGVGYDTVLTHCQRACEKVGVRTQEELVGRLVASRDWAPAPEARGTLEQAVDDLARTCALSQLQVHILVRLARGMRNKGIAAELGLSRHTISKHLAIVCRNTGTSAPEDLVAKLVRAL